MSSAVVVFGGYGTFGRHVARELVRLGVEVVIAGRDRDRAEAFARSLDPPQRSEVADVTSLASCRSVLRGRSVAAHCGGPFGGFGPELLEACLAEGCHYVDIADDRAYAALVRERGPRFAERGLAAVSGCSSLPGLSGALALLARDGLTAPPQLVRVTLMIGNANPKGPSAVRSLLGQLGRPIAAPQGPIPGFGDREVVPLPAPFGPRAVYNFNSPEYDLFPPLLGVTTVRVKVGFELRAATAALAWLAALPVPGRPRMAGLLTALGRPFQSLGGSGGAILTELFAADGSSRCASISTHRDGQRMAALPCALVAQPLSLGRVHRTGALTAYESLGPRPLLDTLTTEGFTLQVK